MRSAWPSLVKSRTGIDRVSDRFGIKPERLTADTAHDKGEMLGWLVQQRGIAQRSHGIDKSSLEDHAFERAGSARDAENGIFTCPGGKALRQIRRAIARTAASAGRRSRCCFACLKRSLGLNRLRSGGPSGAHHECHPTTTAQPPGGGPRKGLPGIPICPTAVINRPRDR